MGSKNSSPSNSDSDKEDSFTLEDRQTEGDNDRPPRPYLLDDFEHRDELPRYSHYSLDPEITEVRSQNSVIPQELLDRLLMRDLPKIPSRGTITRSVATESGV